MKMQTAELIGDPLDWAVAKALGAAMSDADFWLKVHRCDTCYSYSGFWEAGGELLEQCVEQGMLVERVDPQYKDLQKFKATFDRWETVYRADELLVAVCRCFVAHKLGLEVDIPEVVLGLPVEA